MKGFQPFTTVGICMKLDNMTATMQTIPTADRRECKSSKFNRFYRFGIEKNTTPENVFKNSVRVTLTSCTLL